MMTWLRGQPYGHRHHRHAAQLGSARRLFLTRLLELHTTAWLQFFGTQAELADATALRRRITLVRKKTWVVYAKPPFAGLRKAAAHLAARREHADDVVLVGLGLILLTLGGETLDDLGSGIATIARRTRQDGKRHNLTLASKSGGGLTVHCGPEFDAMAAESLARHCHVRKYSRRTNSWYGLFAMCLIRLPTSVSSLL